MAHKQLQVASPQVIHRPKTCSHFLSATPGKSRSYCIPTVALQQQASKLSDNTLQIRNTHLVIHS